MKAYEIIRLACLMTDNDALAEKLTEENIASFDENFSAKEKETVKKYLDSLNFIQNEIATERQLLVTEETLSTDNFKISLDQFSKPICDVLSVKDLIGRNVKFKVYPSYVLAFANVVKVQYVYAPEKLELTCELEITLPEHILAAGVAREYCLRMGLYEDAEMFERRFKDGLKVMLRKKAEIKMPGRRWF